ncbi:hypothetical protein INR49_014260 [Caranx melampygus]|nr:hypothetical protein INR49_014260 [Caranx melampygus]
MLDDFTRQYNRMPRRMMIAAPSAAAIATSSHFCSSEPSLHCWVESHSRPGSKQHPFAQRCNAIEGKNRGTAQSSSEPYSGLRHAVLRLDHLVLAPVGHRWSVRLIWNDTSKRKQELIAPSSAPLSIKATLHLGSLQQDATQSLYRSSLGDERNVAPSFTDSSVSRTKSSRPLWNLSKHSPASWPPVEARDNKKSRRANAPHCAEEAGFMF